MIAIDQIRTVDKKRIIKILGKLNKVEIKLTKEVIKETLFIFDSYTTIDHHFT
jgi:mRNA interferase MazF